MRQRNLPANLAPFADDIAAASGAKRKARTFEALVQQTVAAAVNVDLARLPGAVLIEDAAEHLTDALNSHGSAQQTSLDSAVAKLRAGADTLREYQEMI